MSRAADLLVAAARLWNVASGNTGQSQVCAAFLLGLYNGTRFPFDLTDLRLLDADLRRAAFDLLAADASHTLQCEVHELLNTGTGRRDFGARFEHLAHDWGRKGRCLRKFLTPVQPTRLLLKLPTQPAAPAPPASALQATPDVAARPWAEPN